jgi:hypothetical protein
LRRVEARDTRRRPAQDRVRHATTGALAALVLVVVAASGAAAGPPAAQIGDGATNARPGELVRRGAIGVVAPPPGERTWGEVHFVDGTFETLEIETDAAGRVYARAGNARNELGHSTSTGGEGAAALEGTGSAAPLSPAPSSSASQPALTPAPSVALAAPTASPKPTPTPNLSAAECTSTSYSLYSWRKPTYSWSFHTSSTPSTLADRSGGTGAVVNAIKRANNNIVSGRNVCGRADYISATYTYLGSTGRAPNIASTATCSGGNGYSSIGFGSLPSGVAAMACAYRIVNGVAAEGDAKLSTRVRWATSSTSCSDAYLIEAVMTHEFGHIYGLRHVTSPALTMYPSVRKCSGTLSTLGVGDLRGLERKY